MTVRVQVVNEADPAARHEVGQILERLVWADPVDVLVRVVKGKADLCYIISKLPLPCNYRKEKKRQTSAKWVA